jgi:hypothetical protein
MFELKVLTDTTHQSKSVNKELWKENDQLLDKLGKMTFLTQANLKKIIVKFQKHTTNETQAATTNALKQWDRQTTELLVLRVDNAN